MGDESPLGSEDESDGSTLEIEVIEDDATLGEEEDEEEAAEEDVERDEEEEEDNLNRIRTHVTIANQLDVCVIVFCSMAPVLLFIFVYNFYKRLFAQLRPDGTIAPRF
ncbi:hypothetical protein PRIPAC_92845 [Pristionchus pacificus]|uniref:Uncharacterized protein n=1 Tax=Pristionchus pacificus TaxID=54126 RepID=A0A454XZR0_PRIPA|nr:hypothetical protein PRIPAC_92845 [Pristionchus pacificus]|eukprot:PDM76009.1 hypothetical protein PRIPAC_39613 [Pristionchus pacificus]